MRIIFTNRLDTTTLLPPEDAFTFEIEDDAGKYLRGSFVTWTQESDILNGGGGNSKDDSNVITEDPIDCVVFHENAMRMQGIVIFKIIVLRPAGYVCYCVVRDYRKYRIMLQTKVAEQNYNFEHSGLRLNPILADSTIVTLPGRDVTAGIRMQFSVRNDGGPPEEEE